MRLKLLKMKAFGSYGTEAEIDFSSLGGGLYLIRGATGSGKTTIFDAIVFALYGSSSGGARTPEMMHSDFVSKREPTVVELVFEHGGAEHKVRRTQAFTRHRNGEFSAQSPGAEFWEAGRSVIEGSRAVTARISELLGICAEQFRQIVMLAQGDFKRFLEAGSDERSTILAEIFDTGRYRALADRLVRARAILAARRGEDENSIRHLIGAMEVPQDYGEEASSRLRPVERLADGSERVLIAPGLVGELESLVEFDRSRAEEARTALSEIEEATELIRNSKAIAEMRNAHLDELERAKSRKAALEAQAKSMCERETVLGRAKRARAVAEREMKVKEAIKYRDAAEAEVGKAKRDLKSAEDAARAAAEECASLDSQRSRLNEIAVVLHGLKEEISHHVELATASAALSRHEAARDLCLAKAAEAKAELDGLAGEIASLDRDISAMGDAGAALESAKSREREAERLLKSFKSISVQAQGLKKLAGDLDGERGSLKRAAEDASMRRAEWSCAYELFIRGQAGILASSLADEIRTKGTALCPVCGTAHSQIGEAFASLGSHIPSEAAVNEARSLFDDADKAREQRQSRVDGLEAEMRSRQESLVGATAAIPGCGDASAQNVLDESWIRRHLDDFARALEDATEIRGKAEKRRESLNQLQERRATCETRRGQLEVALRNAESAASESARHAAEAKGSVDRLKALLSHPTKEAAEAELSAIERERVSLQGKVDGADARKAESDRRLAAAGADLKAKEEELSRNEMRHADCRRLFEEALSAGGYGNIVEYRADAAYLPENGVNEWLEREEREIAGYRERVANSAAEAARLEEATRGFVRENLEEIDRLCAEMADRKKAAGERHVMRTGLLRDHEKALAAVRKAVERLAGTEAGMRRLNELAMLASGRAGGGADRVDFERYMLGDRLREVLEQANVRLDMMSGGRFELVHRAEGRDRRGAAGLDIDVLDHMTGVQRQAASFSGGEGFMASMALALGLADAVRNHAGDVSLESVFIDEGFGSLDDDVLEKSIAVLKDLAGDSRQVGIISHVAKLEEDVWPQIVVESGDCGSAVRIERR